MRGGALLIDVDSTIPNVALMHISAWRKSLGIRTGFRISDPDPPAGWPPVHFPNNPPNLAGLTLSAPDPNLDIRRGGHMTSRRSFQRRSSS